MIFEDHLQFENSEQFFIITTMNFFLKLPIKYLYQDFRTKLSKFLELFLNINFIIDENNFSIANVADEDSFVWSWISSIDSVRLIN